MSRLFGKILIEDFQNEKCSDAELEALLDTFEYTVKKMATTLARESYYILKDYTTSRQRGIEGFTLTLERKNVTDHEQWHGVFEYGDKNLMVIGTFQEN